MLKVQKDKNIELTNEQMECINYTSGDLLIKGEAGTGKTFVLVNRAIRLQKESERVGKKIKIGVFTYSSTLAKYTHELLVDLGADMNVITVYTVDGYANKIAKAIGYNWWGRLISSNEPYKYIKIAIGRQISELGEKHRVHKLDYNFLLEEFGWIKGRNIKNVLEYTNAERKGRGGECKIIS